MTHTDQQTDLQQSSAAPESSGLVLEVKGLKTHFFTHAGVVKAVDGVDLRVAPGEILGLVGESGSGKSITGFSIMGLIDEPGRVAEGSIKFMGKDILQINREDIKQGVLSSIAHPIAQVLRPIEKALQVMPWYKNRRLKKDIAKQIRSRDQYMQKLRGKDIAMIFQDPMMTLNPVLRIDKQMIEAIMVHEKTDKASALKRCEEALDMVGIPAPKERLKNYPHELSGGMRQRVAIAIALLNKPKLIIADEPTTALDVTIQAQILYEVQKLCQQTGTALVWITHDLAIVSRLADRIAVMYAGRIVEDGPTRAIIKNTTHPYTLGLMQSIPTRETKGQMLQQIPGMTPSLLNLPQGCPFRPRCPYATTACLEEPLVTQVTPEQSTRCWNYLTKPKSA